MTQSGMLIEFLKVNPLPWLWYDEAKGKFILVLDNHLMSTYRACPQHFINAHVLGLRRKTSAEKPERVWFLEFGICLHEMLEKYYKTFRELYFDKIKFCTEEAIAVWNKHQMDEFSSEKEYQTIGGFKGFVGLLTQYATVLASENEHLRVLGTEVSFGKNLEVPIYIGEEFEVYLSGRMDIIVDDGYFICPMDHKSFAVFKGDVALRYATDEGPTGYVFALSTVLPKLVPEKMLLKRDCSKILMNLISKAPTKDPRERFKRITLRKTTWELEQYKLRMQYTASHLLSTVDAFVQGNPVYRNTQVCQNWMHRTCAYFDICRQQSREGELVTIQNGFTTVPLWDTEKVGKVQE
jgi:hypothetical protein